MLAVRGLIPGVGANSPPPEVLLEGLTLRHPSLQTAQEKCDLVAANRGYLAAWLPWPKDFTLDQAQDDARPRPLTIRAGRLLPYDLLAENERIVGDMKLYRRKGGSMKLGYWLAEREQGKGYIRQAAPAVVEIGFRNLGLELINLHIERSNQRSQEVARFLGARLTDQVERPTINGKVRNLDVWEVNRYDYF